MFKDPALDILYGIISKIKLIDNILERGAIQKLGHNNHNALLVGSFNALKTNRYRYKLYWIVK